MFHEPPIDFIYSAYKIETKFSDGSKTISGIATGFILALQNKPWIVTNRHVIDKDYKTKTNKYKDFKLIELSITGRYPDDSTYTHILHPGAAFHYHNDYENDVVLIQALVLDNTNDLHWHFTFNHLATSEIYKKIEPFDLVCFTGFPDQHDKLGQRPILRSGNIASDPKFNYSWNKEHQGQCVAYEGFSSNGASGSPIFAPARGMKGMNNSRNGYIIGVNAGHVPDNFNHSGISYFYKSTVIEEIIIDKKLV